MRVHPSNYRVVGFASTRSERELAALAHEAGLPLYEDGGSGQLADLRKYGVVDEPVVREIIESGVDVVSFSGDKLLGSAQAGLIIEAIDHFATAQASTLSRAAQRQAETGGTGSYARFASTRRCGSGGAADPDVVRIRGGTRAARTKPG